MLEMCLAVFMIHKIHKYDSEIPKIVCKCQISNQSTGIHSYGLFHDFLVF